MLKPWQNEKLPVTLAAAMNLRQSRLQVDQPRSRQQLLSADIDQNYRGFIGASPAMKSTCNHRRTALAFHGGKSYILVCQKCFINVDGVSYLIGIPMKKISISSLGQLSKADIDFGDMTILGGPQASGKSILLQPKLSEDILTGKSFKTYYFAKHYKKFKTMDISTLDPGSMNEAVSEWRALTSFSTRVSEVV